MKKFASFKQVNLIDVSFKYELYLKPFMNSNWAYEEFIKFHISWVLWMSNLSEFYSDIENFRWR